MIRAAVLATAVLLPAVALADEVWRWKDPSGRLHYSNVRAHIPRYAEPVATDIGHASLRPLPAQAAAPRAQAYEAPREARIPFRSEVRAVGSCWPFGFPYVVINNPHELADQLKQASLLDALGVPWRKGCCL